MELTFLFREHFGTASLPRKVPGDLNLKSAKFEPEIAQERQLGCNIKEVEFFKLKNSTNRILQTC